MQKSVLFIIVFAVIFQNNSIAQFNNNTSSREAKRKVVPGIKAGVNHSNVYKMSGEAFASERKQSVAAGVFISLPLNRFIGFQPEAVYQQKGFEGSGMLLGDRYLLSRTTTHIDIPLQLQFKPFKWLTILGGPNYSYLIRQSDKFSYVDNSVAKSGVGFENSDSRKSTFGTIVGFDLNFKHLVLSGRSGWDVSESQTHVGTGEPNYRNRWLQGTVGYRFY